MHSNKRIVKRDGEKAKTEGNSAIRSSADERKVKAHYLDSETDDASPKRRVCWANFKLASRGRAIYFGASDRRPTIRHRKVEAC